MVITMHTRIRGIATTTTSAAQQPPAHVEHFVL